MRIYISGAITNDPDHMKKFARADEKLTQEGWEVMNPALIGSCFPKSTTHSEFMKLSFLELELCDAVYFLNGWKSSTGACMEYGFAYAKDMILMFEEEKKEGE